MINMTLNTARAVCGGSLARTTLAAADTSFRGLSTDTRSIEPGQLFAALRGPSFDAHDFVEAAAEAGATAAIVAREVDAPLAQLVVGDTLVALGQLAHHWRSQLDVRVAAVTGSNGKTSVKELLAAMLGAAGPTLATAGNLNNHIGVPLTLCRLERMHRYAALEIGASAPGEVARLATLARPAVGIITLCAPAHIEGFGSIEGVARAKGEMVLTLPPDGVAVINADDEYAPLWREYAAPRRVIAFGDSADADTRASASADGLGSRVELSLAGGVEVRARLALPGAHAVRNALAAATAAQALGVGADAIAAGIEAARPVKGRLRPVRLRGGHLLLDDSYNANPESLSAALDVLVQAGLPTVVVLGDMAELGADAMRYHAEAGAAMAARGIGSLHTCGPLGQHAVGAFAAQAQGSTAHSSRRLAQAAVVAQLRAAPSACAVLVKGSRSAAMDRLVATLEREIGTTAPGPTGMGEATCC